MTQSVAFYDATLAHLGYERVMTFDTPGQQVAGYGVGQQPYFWIGVELIPEHEERVSEQIGNARGFHAAFLAPSVEAVHAWYDECITQGGACNGKPGPRSEYHQGYYGAFIIDPNGWRTEACFHQYKK